MARTNRKGFTLVELMVVIAVMSITVAAIPAIWTWQGVARTNTAVRGLAADLRMARSVAVDRNHDVVVEFDAANNAYAIYADADGDGPEIDELIKSVQLSELGKSVVFGSNSSAKIGGDDFVAAVDLDGSPSPARITLKANGEALRWGALYLASAKDLQSGDTDRNRAVQILKTGRVSMLRWTGGSPDPWIEYY
ncbi:MAG: GspH/FimT family pseudopilin [Deltaproteobacteria bacterium]|nr:GspH/FimT family pseudopilin [Deltaproteobacteria bacterium]